MFSFEKFTMKRPIRKEILNFEFFFGNILNSKICDYVDRLGFQNLIQTIKYQGINEKNSEFTLFLVKFLKVNQLQHLF